MVFGLFPLFCAPAASDSERSIAARTGTGKVTMRVVDAKSGTEASVDAFMDFRDAVARALLAQMSAGDAAPFADGAPYADWDNERRNAAMSRVQDAAQAELRRWLPPSPPTPPPASVSSLGFGFEAEILQRETHTYPPSPPRSTRDVVPADCPPALRILRLHGLWRLMRIDSGGVCFMECGEAKEVLLVLERARPLVSEAWKDAVGELIRVGASCEGNSFLIWG